MEIFGGGAFWQIVLKYQKLTLKSHLGLNGSFDYPSKLTIFSFDYDSKQTNVVQITISSQTLRCAFRYATTSSQNKLWSFDYKTATFSCQYFNPDLSYFFLFFRANGLWGFHGASAGHTDRRAAKRRRMRDLKVCAHQNKNYQIT